MTEQEWLAWADPTPMLELVCGNASDRKRRLFTVACCRKVWQVFPDEPCRRAVEVAERFADGNAPEEELAAAREAASYAPIPGLAAFEAAQAALTVAASDAIYHAWDVATADFTFQAAALAAVDADSDAVSKEQADLLRDFFRNPFKPVAFEPTWITPTILRLAQAAYDNRSLPLGTLDPAHLAVLSDALEEAGCTEATIIDHLRRTGPHIRGCWAVDLILGKK